MASKATGSGSARRRSRASENPRPGAPLHRPRAVHQEPAADQPPVETVGSLLHRIALLADTTPEALTPERADELLLVAGRLALQLRPEPSPATDLPEQLPLPLEPGPAGIGTSLWRELQESTTDLAAAGWRLSALNRAAAALTGDLEIGEVLEGIIGQALEVLSARGAALLLPGEAGGALELRAQRGLDVGEPVTIPQEAIAAIEGPFHLVAADESSPSWARELLAAGRGRALALLPLHDEGRLVGLLALESRIEAWPGPEKAEARAFAALAARALLSARHRRETEAAAAETTFLLQISQLLNSTFDVGSIVQTLVDEASDLVANELCILYLYDPIADELDLRGTQGASVERVAAAGLQRVSLAKLPGTRQAARAGQPTLDEGKSEGDLPSLLRAAFGVQASMTIPLRARGTLLGFLILMRQAPQLFSLPEMELASKLGALAALALDNARLYANLTEQMQQVRAAQAQLIEVEKMASLGRIVAGVAHELNNPLAIISGYAQMLLDGGVPPELRGDLERIDRGARRAAQVVRELLAFARQQPIVPTSIEVTALVDEVLEQELPALREGHIRVELSIDPGLPRIRGDRLQLSQVLGQLIANARHAIAGRPGPGTITIGALYNGRLLLTVADDGSGIPPHLLDKVFEPFLTTQETGHGMGLGLSTCYGIIRAHGGRIWATNNPEGGATFHVELPASREERPPH